MRALRPSVKVKQRKARRPPQDPSAHLSPLSLGIAVLALGAAMLVGVSIGPADLPFSAVWRSLADHLPLVHLRTGLTPLDSAIIWQVRLPRVVLGGIVGSMLAGSGAAYQGVFRNPLADPYLLGVAAGGGLGATLAIIFRPEVTSLLPIAAFVGAAAAVGLTYLVGATVGHEASTMSILLAGIAVAALFTAVQTYLQQQHTPSLQAVYSWILGDLTLADWADVRLILPYVVLSGIILLSHRRMLDVLRVGEDEANSLGINAGRVRLVVVFAATLGTAAVVSVSGLIGFVGIIVPHAVRLTTNASYRVVVPLSMIGGAAFLISADILARTVQSPAEVPIGVVTAFVGGPFFLFVLRSRRAQRSVL